MKEPMRITAADHVNLRVKDVEATLAFYQGVLGLQPDRLDDFRAGRRPLFAFRVREDFILHVFPESHLRPRPGPGLRPPGARCRRDVSRRVGGLPGGAGRRHRDADGTVVGGSRRWLGLLHPGPRRLSGRAEGLSATVGALRSDRFQVQPPVIE